MKMAGDGVIGALLVTLGVDTGAFEDGLKSTQGKLSGFGAAMGTIGKTAFLAVGAAAAAAGAAMVKFGFDAIDAGDDIGDAAARLGIAASEYQKLQIAGVKAGGSTELMSTAMDKLNQNLGAAHMGSKGMSEAFKTLGLDADKLKTGDQAFYAIAKGMEGIKDPAEKAKLSMQLFGKAAGVDMLEVLGAGGDALKQYGNEAQKSGRVMSDEMVKKLGDAKLMLDDTSSAMKQMATVFAGQGVIAIVDLAQKMTPVIDQMKSIGTQIYNYLKPSLDELGSAFKSLASNQALIATLKTIGTVIGGVLVVGFKLIVEAVTLTIKAIDGLYNAFASSIKWINDTAHTISNFGKAIIDGLVNSIKGGAQWAVDAIKNLANQMMTGFKKAWGIESPSKVAAQYGKHIDEGFAKGINDNAYLPLEAMGNLSFELMKKLHGKDWSNALNEDLKSLVDGFKTAQEKAGEDFGNKIFTIDVAEKAGKIGKEFAEKLRKAAEEEFARNGAIEVTANLDVNLLKRDEISPLDPTVIQNSVDDLSNFMADNQKMSDAFASTMKNGLEAALDGDFKGFATSVLKGIADKAFASIFQSLGDQLFGVTRTANDNGGGGGFIQAISSAFSSIFGAGKAGGGSVNSGTPYLIGEVGPELFVPQTSGTIVPNSKLLAKNGDTNVFHFNLTMPNVTDYASFKKSEGQMSALLANAVSRGMRNK